MIARGARVRALIVVLWRGRAAVQEALALGERDLAPRRGSLPVRRDKGGCRREIGMDAWGWEQLSPGSPRASSYPSGRCCASPTARLEAAPGGAPASASSSVGSPPGVSGGM
jgi:hypothetical protein